MSSKTSDDMKKLHGSASLHARWPVSFGALRYDVQCSLIFFIAKFTLTFIHIANCTEPLVFIQALSMRSHHCLVLMSC